MTTTGTRPPPPRPAYNFRVKRPNMADTVGVRLHAPFCKKARLDASWHDRWARAQIANHPDSDSLDGVWQFFDVPGVTLASTYSLPEWRPLRTAPTSEPATSPRSRTARLSGSSLNCTTYVDAHDDLGEILASLGLSEHRREIEPLIRPFLELYRRDRPTFLAKVRALGKSVAPRGSSPAPRRTQRISLFNAAALTAAAPSRR